MNYPFFISITITNHLILSLIYLLSHDLNQNIYIIINNYFKISIMHSNNFLYFPNLNINLVISLLLAKLLILMNVNEF